MPYPTPNTIPLGNGQQIVIDGGTVIVEEHQVTDQGFDTTVYRVSAGSQWSTVYDGEDIIGINYAVGKVGINNENPEAMLDIIGHDSSNRVQLLSGDEGTYNRIYITLHDTTGDAFGYNSISMTPEEGMWAQMSDETGNQSGTISVSKYGISNVVNDFFEGRSTQFSQAYDRFSFTGGYTYVGDADYSKLYLWDSANAAYAPISMTDGQWIFSDFTEDHQFVVSIGDHGAALDFSSLTAFRGFSAPDRNGVLALEDRQAKCGQNTASGSGSNYTVSIPSTIGSYVVLISPLNAAAAAAFAAGWYIHNQTSTSFDIAFSWSSTCIFHWAVFKY